PHPAAWGTFPKVLETYVRRRGLLSLEQAVHKMTRRPAELLGLGDRGIVRRGAFADLVLFDFDTVGTGATYEHPREPARGIRWVIVNGRVVAGEGEVPEPPGRVLRRPG